MKAYGLIYILTNPSFPGLVKIGFTTTDLTERVRQLSATNIPTPFEIAYACGVRDCLAVEKGIHEKLSGYRVNPKREFFRISPHEALKILLLVINSLDPGIEPAMVVGSNKE